MKTTVEWLVNELDLDMDLDSKWIIEQAKELHKQEIIDAFLEGCSDNNNDGYEYYNQTFKSE